MSSDTGQPTVTTSRFFSRIDSEHLQCDLCPRLCKLKDGQRGVCFVRARVGDQVVLTTYGRSTGFCVDPIEKKPLNHFYPGTSVLSFGTAGCNLKCKYCQNWDISASRDLDHRAGDASPDTIARAAQQFGCRSVAFTYNDPVIFLEYAYDVAQACHEAGVKTVAVTAGYINPEPRAELFRYIDAANVDLKAFTQKFYRKLCGGELKAVLDTLVYLKHETNVWLELTTLLIPGENDSDIEIDKLTRWVAAELGADTPIHFTAFHPDYKMLSHPATSPKTLTRAYHIASANGLHFPYTGNVHDPDGGMTRCSGCSTVLISRDWHRLTGWRLRPDGTCPECGLACPGYFESGAGRWGGRRLPVQVSDFTVKK